MWSGDGMRRWVFFITLRAPLWTIMLGAATIVIAWILGRVLTDRFAWSQWLWWIPTIAALAAAFVLTILVAMPVVWGRADRGATRKRSAAASAALLILIGGYFFLVEHRFFPRGGSVDAATPSISVVHWNLGQMPPPRGRAAYASALFDMRGADILVLTAPNGILWHESLLDYLREGEQMIQLGKFVVITRFAVGAPSFVSQESEQQITVLPVDTREALGEGIVIWMADFPSDPKIPRMDFARKLAQLIATRGLPAPDVVLGDFNITRGSASIEGMFHGLNLHHGYDDAGQGYAASFPRAPLPWWHIDHMYLSRRWRAIEYEMFDPGIGRHKAQRAVMKAAD
jgi:hypothetical protein